MEDSRFKITDRRMFTAEGELREEYRFLEREGGGTEPLPAPAPPPAVQPSPQPQPQEAPPQLREGAAGPPLELPQTTEVGGGPSFLDLVAMIAEPASIYLGDIELPDGSTAEDPHLARLHIELLDLLRRKTAGNLSAQELAVLEDVLYRLRMRYVQKRG